MPLPSPRQRLPERPPDEGPHRDFPPGPPGKFIPPPRKAGVGNTILKVAVVCLVLIGGLFFLLYEPDLMSTAGVDEKRILTLANMRPLPKSAQDINVVQPEELKALQGAQSKPLLMLQFRATDAELKQWISDSPGTKDVVPTMEGLRDFVYRIGGSSNKSTFQAELRWFRSEGRVLLSVAPDSKSISASGKWQPKDPEASDRLIR